MKFILPLLLTVTSLAQLPVTTRSFTNDRAGVNSHETKLNPNSVVSIGLHRETTIPVYGDARGTESQPLIMPNVAVKRQKQDVMVLPSLANVVRGVNAETGAGLWATTLGRPVDNSTAVDFHMINDKWGVLSTGVIDPDTNRVYLVAWVSPDGTPEKAGHFIFCLNISDGSLVGSAVPLSSAVSGTQRYDSAERKQRSSLLLTKVHNRKTIFFASGTVTELNSGSAGWIFAYDIASNKLAASLALSEGNGAGVWMAGQGLAADSQGYIYAITGNGTFNAINAFGESFIKMQYQPPAGAAPAWIKVVDWWSPYTDSGRVGQDVTFSSPRKVLENKLSGVSAPSQEVEMPVNGQMKMSMKGARTIGNRVYPKVDIGTWSDEDLGSAGGTLIEQYNLYIGGGKDGILYPVKSNNMGRTQPADFINAKANCNKLAGPPVWGTASPGPVDTCPQDPSTLNFMPWGKTRHLHMTPVAYMNQDTGLSLFVWGENSQLHKWHVDPTGTLTYVAQGQAVASVTSLNSPGGMPGGFCTLSSNNNRTGTSILWCSVPYGDANATVTYGRLIAYDADKVVNGTIPVLWDSEVQRIPYVYNKFMAPIVWNGRVYLPNYNGGVDVYGLNK